MDKGIDGRKIKCLIFVTEFGCGKCKVIFSKMIMICPKCKGPAFPFEGKSWGNDWKLIVFEYNERVISNTVWLGSEK